MNGLEWKICGLSRAVIISSRAICRIIFWNTPYTCCKLLRITGIVLLWTTVISRRTIIGGFHVALHRYRANRTSPYHLHASRHKCRLFLSHRSLPLYPPRLTPPRLCLRCFPQPPPSRITLLRHRSLPSPPSTPPRVPRLRIHPKYQPQFPHQPSPLPSRRSPRLLTTPHRSPLLSHHRAPLLNRRPPPRLHNLYIHHHHSPLRNASMMTPRSRSS